jgi:hypothetical protein
MPQHRQRAEAIILGGTDPNAFEAVPPDSLRKLSQSGSSDRRVQPTGSNQNPFAPLHPCDFAFQPDFGPKKSSLINPNQGKSN